MNIAVVLINCIIMAVLSCNDNDVCVYSTLNNSDVMNQTPTGSSMIEKVLNNELCTFYYPTTFPLIQWSKEIVPFVPQIMSEYHYDHINKKYRLTGNPSCMAHNTPYLLSNITINA